ncbi:hypothetical protein Q7P37_000198 [Cladosporium fusiforme]
MLFALCAIGKLGLAHPGPSVDEGTHGRRDFKHGISTAANSGLAGYNKSRASVAKFGSNELDRLRNNENAECLTQLDITTRPHRIDGKVIRKDLVEGQEGVPLYVDIQMIDTNTCEPLVAVYLDFWHCNATGVCNSIVSDGNSDEDGQRNMNTFWMRGVQPSDSSGVVQFETIFPGYHTGRAAHIHVACYPVSSTPVGTNGTLLVDCANFTSSSSHIGQLFFDEYLVSEVSTLYPCNSTDQACAYNDEDEIHAGEADRVGPFMKYALIGDRFEDGILAWIDIGIDFTVHDALTSAATKFNNEGDTSMESSTGPSDGEVDSDSNYRATSL